ANEGHSARSTKNFGLSSFELKISAVDVREGKNRFLSCLESERRASPNTVLAYGRDLEALVLFLEEKKERDLSRITVYALRGFLGERAKTLAAASMGRQVATIR